MCGPDVSYEANQLRGSILTSSMISSGKSIVNLNAEVARVLEIGGLNGEFDCCKALGMLFPTYDTQALIVVWLTCLQAPS